MNLFTMRATEAIPVGMGKGRNKPVFKKFRGVGINLDSLDAVAAQNSADNQRKAVAKDHGMDSLFFQHHHQFMKKWVELDRRDILRHRLFGDADRLQLSFETLFRPDLPFLPALFIILPIAIDRKTLDNVVEHVKRSNGVIEI